MVSFIDREMAEEISKQIEKEQSLCHHVYERVDVKDYLLLSGKWQRCKKCKKMLDISLVPEEMLWFG